MTESNRLFEKINTIDYSAWQKLLEIQTLSVDYENWKYH